MSGPSAGEVGSVLAPGPSFFLAGVMQGGRRTAALADQGYREQLRLAIKYYFPTAEVVDPGEVMERELRHPGEARRRAHMQLLEKPVVYRDELGPELAELIGMFHRLTELAGACDVVIVWLPDHEPSMGTAAEMLAAHRAGRKVVSITEMRQNLAVLSCSDVILPDFSAFLGWLDDASGAAGSARATQEAFRLPQRQTEDEPQ